MSEGSTDPGRRRWRLFRNVLLLFAAALVVAGAWACSPIYVIKAGIAEAKILKARRQITDVLADPSTDSDTRGKLSFVLEARRYAADELGVDVGQAYTMYTKLDRDTLALVLSAAYKDRLASKTWWFPIVGRVPYKGYFDVDDAREGQADLEEDGLDTYLRPTGAFSTLGWFNDPVLSTVLRDDELGVVETVLHELSHNFLFVPGQVGFNESFATFVGGAGAAEFFCTREGGGTDTVKCERARARWRDFQRYSVFVDGLVDDLQAVYGDTTLTFDQKVGGREEVFARALRRFEEITPDFENVGFGGFRQRPLNNATLLTQIFYYHRLPDFQALLDSRGGDLRTVMEELKAGAPGASDPFDLLPRASGGP